MLYEVQTGDGQSSWRDLREMVMRWQDEPPPVLEAFTVMLR